LFSGSPGVDLALGLQIMGVVMVGWHL